MDADLTRCLDGDADAWRRLVERVMPVVNAAVARCLRRHGAHEVAVEDVAQDVFLRLVRDDFRVLRGFDPARAALTTWLTVVAHRCALDACRRRRPGAEGLPADLAAPPLAPIAEPLPLDGLPPRQRLVIELLFTRGLDVEEAAAVLGIEAQTVRSLKHKALSRLREQLGGDEAAFDDVPRGGRSDVPG
ncbi:MAG TPA: sigma-70 family RNA polymerase sigma factor [Planctomycetota bacterium]|nr:sigma-70 family RNA polymerase sigma factor [Planctomycetota bacterium]